MTAFRYSLKTCFALTVMLLIPQVHSFTQSTDTNAEPLIKLNVLVTDKSKRPVMGLNQEDFLVYDEGKQQTISLFQKRDIPVSYVLIVDNTGSLFPRSSDVIEAAKNVVNGNRPEDQTFILRLIDKEALIAADWTSDKSILLNSLSAMKESKGRMPLIDSVYSSSEEIAKHLAAEDVTNRRRAIVLITDGIEHDSSRKLDELLNHLLKNQVQVFVIGIMKLHSQNIFDDDMRRKATEFLKTLAEETGGRAVFPDPGKEIKNSAEIIAGYLRSQYVIGYSPPPDAKKESARKVRVKIVNAPGREKYSVTAPLRYAPPSK